MLETIKTQDNMRKGFPYIQESLDLLPNRGVGFGGRFFSQRTIFFPSGTFLFHKCTWKMTREHFNTYWGNYLQYYNSIILTWISWFNEIWVCVCHFFAFSYSDQISECLRSFMIDSSCFFIFLILQWVIAALPLGNFPHMSTLIAASANVIVQLILSQLAESPNDFSLSLPVILVCPSEQPKRNLKPSITMSFFCSQPHNCPQFSAMFGKWPLLKQRNS